MSDSNLPTASELTRQVRQHLESLRASGVEWLPAAKVGSQFTISDLCAQDSAQARSQAAPDESATQPEGSHMSGTTTKSHEISHADVEGRGLALQVLAAEVAKCTRCPELSATRTQTVFGVGKLDSDLCFIGEAPGADEDATGEPFVGAAGKLLNRIIAACGMKREEVYICNIIKCRPPGNRPPLPNEAANCREYLDKQLELVKPHFICALGATAAQYLLGTKQSIGRLRGQFQEYKGVPVMCTYHPAYLLRSPERKADVWEDMKKLMTRMGRTIPKK